MTKIQNPTSLIITAWPAWPNVSEWQEKLLLTREKILMVAKSTSRPRDDSRKPMTAPERKAAARCPSQNLAVCNACNKHRTTLGVTLLLLPERRHVIKAQCLLREDQAVEVFESHQS